MQFDIAQLPVWFLVFLVFGLGSYFLWSFPRFINSVKDSVGKIENNLEKMTEKLFEKTDNHETRLSSLEGEHNGFKTMHDRRSDEGSQPHMKWNRNGSMERTK